ncbi:unnamed protein product [Schistosoma curassoni]|uniref:Endo/exonuclease/phosphatase domain-containing protein n=1 Tax=Schistosoma curassoni TaxID=6186 RepID=A0A183JR86_9TREM|nr:unnamed protein product [Schistosoma curassoni]
MFTGTWNVRTMWYTGKTSQIATEMRKYNLEVLGISEAHWTQAGQKSQDTEEMLLYSGHEEEDAPYTQGVALMLFKVTQNALVGWKSHESRIIKASFKTKKEGITMNIFRCCAPTNDSNDDIRDQFYERLQSIIEKCPKTDLTIRMGDLNAKVGIDNTGYEDIMRRHGLGEKRKWQAPMNTPNIEAAHTGLPIDVNLPTTEQIRMAIRQIESGKAAGPGNIPAEALKLDVEVTTNMLHLLFRKIWKEEQVPMDWKEGLLINIPKKGDLGKCENYTTDHL